MKRSIRLALLLAVAVRAGAQESPTGFAGLTGVVVDSLRGGYLRGAAVKVEGTSRFAFTDSLGRYTIDSVPAGAHAVELFHEILDTLGMRVYTPPVSFAASVTVELALGVPSPRTIIRAKCQAADDAGAVFGVVLNADNEEPLPGAEVRLSWVELTVSREAGVRYEPNRRVVTTDASGRFKICYLPTDLSADITAARGGDSTSSVPVAYDESKLATATIFLATADFSRAPGVEGGARVMGASVRGVVLDSAGRPVPGARVALASSPDAAVTDSAGSFALTGRPGTQPLLVRRLGYQPVELTVNLSRRAPREVTVRLNVFVPVLDAVLVEARRNLALDRVGLIARRQRGAGRYLLQDELDRRNAVRISDLLSTMPGLHRAGAFGESCITYWVDGIRWQGEPDEFMSPTEVAAIEVYTTNFVPAEFYDFNSCSAVVIWTKWKLRTR